MRRVILALFFSWPLVSLTVAQDSYEPYSFPDKIPAEYNIQPLQDFQKMMTLQSDYVKPGEYRRFCELVTYGKARMFDKGHVYLGWESLETYLNDVLEEIKPAKLPTASKLRAYPAYAARYNAFAMHDGTLLVNIGLLADLQDEASLAIIMGHELAHHMNYDVLRSYKNKLKSHTRRNRNRNEALKIHAAHQDREQEAAADSVGYILASKAGYDLNSAYANYYRFMEMEMDQEGEYSELDYDGERTTEMTSVDELSSHPLTAERLKKLKRTIDSLNPADPQKYIVSKEKFLELRRAARMERLHIFLQYNHFEDCIQHAFRYYLMEPENDVYRYYLMEGMRRASFTEIDYYEEDFLANRYDDYLAEDESILQNLKLVFRDSSMFNAIVHPAFLNADSIPFRTNGEAFTWLENQDKEKVYAEIYLTRALFHLNEPEQKDELLSAYLNEETARFKKFARSFRSDNLMQHLESYDRELVILNDIQFLDDHYYGLHHNRIKEDKTRHDFMEALNGMIDKRFENTQVVNLTQISRTQLNVTKKFERALLASMIVDDLETYEPGNGSVDETSDTTSTNRPKEKRTKRNSGQDGETIIFDEFVENVQLPSKVHEFFSSEDLVLMNPEFWYIFEKNKISRLSYLQVKAFDNKAGIAGNAIFIVLFPIYYYLTGDIPWLYNGSSRYFHNVEMYTYDLKDDRRHYYRHRTEYRLSKGHFLNAVYQAIAANKRK